MAEIAIVGTGRMGAAMTRRFTSAAHRVRVHNRTHATAERLAAETGALVASTPAEAASGADVVISILATGDATEQVLLDDAFLAAIAADTVVCDMATSGVDTARRIAERYRQRGLRFVDAPVSGSVATVDAGGLLVMASGAAADIATISAVLSAVAKRVVRLGEAGAGQAMKLSVNLVVHALNAAVSEALALASAAGVPPESAYDVFENSVVAAPFVSYKRSSFLSDSAPVAMTLALTLKDLDLINTFAQQLGVETLVAASAEASVAHACAAGRGDQDMAALYRHLLGSATGHPPAVGAP